MRPHHQSGLVLERGKKRKVYVGQFNVYVVDQNGKQVRKQRKVVLGYKSQMTKGAAEEKLQQIIFSETKQGVAPTDKVTLDWFWENRFRPMREPGWETATRDGCVYDWSHYIAPKLGQKPLAAFDKFLLQTHFNQLAKAGYSKWIIKRAKTLLSSVFIEAAELKFMGANPMVRVKLPKCKPLQKPVLPAEDARRLYFALPSLRDKLIFRMGVIWGPRTSEIFGLTVDCWKGDHFEIHNTAYKGELRRMKVKTDDSFRTVPVPVELRGMIERWIAEAGLSGTNALFPGRDGESPMWGNTWLQKHVQRVAKQVGITVPITFQVLRRSFSTRHRNELKDAHLVSGHSEETARRLYAQGVSSEARRIVEGDERAIFVEPATEQVQ